MNQLATSSPWKYVILWVRIWFGAHLLYSGMAYVLGGWVPVDMEEGYVGAGTIMVMLNEIGMYPLVKYLEVIAGFMILFNIAVPLALVLELPISLFIFYLNVFVTGTDRHLFTGPQELLLNASLMFAYGGHYVGMLKLKAQPWWLWHGFKQAPAESSASGNLIVAWAIAAVMVVLVILGSMMGPPERILPPRDWLPLILSAVVMAIAMVRDRAAQQ